MPLDGEAFRGPDLKTGPRKQDPKAGKAVMAKRPECCACGYPATNAHHVVPKGGPFFGDDVEENLAPLCGSGSSGCHGAYHGTPYVDREGTKWTKAKVAKKIGAWILADPERLGYVLGKTDPDFLRRRYQIKEIP